MGWLDALALVNPIAGLYRTLTVPREEVKNANLAALGGLTTLSPMGAIKGAYGYQSKKKKKAHRKTNQVLRHKKTKSRIKKSKKRS